MVIAIKDGLHGPPMMRGQRHRAIRDCPERTLVVVWAGSMTFRRRLPTVLLDPNGPEGRPATKAFQGGRSHAASHNPAASHRHRARRGGPRHRSHAVRPDRSTEVIQDDWIQAECDDGDVVWQPLTSSPLTVRDFFDRAGNVIREVPHADTGRRPPSASILRLVRPGRHLPGSKAGRSPTAGDDFIWTGSSTVRDPRRDAISRTPADRCFPLSSRGSVPGRVDHGRWPQTTTGIPAPGDEGSGGPVASRDRAAVRSVRSLGPDAFVQPPVKWRAAGAAGTSTSRGTPSRDRSGPDAARA
jgi:hypothetical protein